MEILFIDCWFIVDSSQYRQYLKFKGGAICNHYQSVGTGHPRRILSPARNETHNNIVVRLVKISSTTTRSPEPLMTPVYRDTNRLTEAIEETLSHLQHPNI